MTFADNDCDGIGDAGDLDADNDGIADVNEQSCIANQDTIDWSDFKGALVSGQTNYYQIATPVTTNDGNGLVASMYNPFNISEASGRNGSISSGTFGGISDQYFMYHDNTSQEQMAIHCFKLSDTLSNLTFTLTDIDVNDLSNPSTNSWLDSIVVMGYQFGKPVDITIADVSFNASFVDFDDATNSFSGLQSVASTSSDANVTITFPEGVNEICIKYGHGLAVQADPEQI